ncbi:MAG: dTDP-4-dehydrorhamnose reductase [Erysipelotrichales bacterium]|nr:dTDP-4-dehydrorhamnose reductase [Erysipelotrichales bacterium]
MKVEKTKISGVLIITPKVFEDSRGWFMETYTTRVKELSRIDFVQDNHSLSKEKNTFRGLHFQNHPYAQSKLVRCIKGSILDFAIDLREDSETYLQSISVELNETNKQMLFIPKGFAHGFLTLTDYAEVTYKVDDLYSYNHDRSLSYKEPKLNLGLTENLILSDKDAKASLLANLKVNFATKILVTGANGQLGYDVCKLLAKKGIIFCAADINDFDITDQKATQNFVSKYKPDIIIHCSAYTAVDKAEEDREKCYAVNVIGTKHIVSEAKKLNAKFIYLSTDYVFSANNNLEISESEKPKAINYYGETKLEGEKLALAYDKSFIVRTSWVFGKNGSNFVKTMLNLAKQKSELQIIDDQIGSPTYTVDLAKALVDLAFTEAYGIYHITNEGFCSWYEFAEFILSSAKINVSLKKISTSEYNAKAKRPHNSRLSKAMLDKNGFTKLPEWKEAVLAYLKEI